MEVKLIEYTPHAIRTIYAAARTCYSSRTTEEILSSLPSEAKMKRLIKKVISQGHTSILEHVTFSFSISGLSRSCSHQLVRHRIASYSQQSQRHVKSRGDYVVPSPIKRRPKAYAVFKRAIDDVYTSYRKLIEMGISKEDARYILPNAQTTNLVMSMDLRELIHAASLRLCSKSQWEIRFLFRKLRRELAKREKFISTLLIPKCKHLGYCPEEHSCGLTPQK
jgi:thymidylate synthase (FAD)